MRVATLVAGALVLVGCTSSRAQDGLEAEVAQILKSAEPISRPLMITYEPAAPARMLTESLVDFGFGQSSMTIDAVQSLVGDGSRLTFHSATLTTRTPTETRSCGDQPLLSSDIELDHYGRVASSKTSGTPGCAASSQTANPSQQGGNNLWLYPQAGIVTGTVLTKDVPPTAAVTGGDARGVVVGSETWRGRPVVVVKLEGCSQVRLAKGWTALCQQGVNLVDRNSGLIVGIISSSRAMSGELTMRISLVPAS